MRSPIPKNKILLFTLMGAVLTGLIAVGLAYPDLATSSIGDGDGDEPTAEDRGVETVADTPEPNQNFTPQVSNRGYEEHEEYEEYYEEDHEEDNDEYEKHDKYEEYHEGEGDDEYEDEEEEHYEDEYEHE